MHLNLLHKIKILKQFLIEKKGDDHLKMARHQKWGSPTVFKLQTPNLHQMNLLTHEKSPWGQIFKFLPLKVILAPF